MEEVSTAPSTGVVYLSTLPPYMDAAKLRHLLQPYARVGRIYLAEEDASKYAHRVKSGGCKKVSYTHGWVEFLRAEEAEQVADTLNARAIGGKKRHNFYHDDIWCMEYLENFTWNDLMEQRVQEKQENRHKLQTALTKQKKQDEKFLEYMAKKKHVDAKRKRKVAKNGSSVTESANQTVPSKKSRREVFQRDVAVTPSCATTDSLLSALAL